MELAKQIVGGHYDFPEQYWKDVSDDGELEDVVFYVYLQSASSGILSYFSQVVACPV